MMTKRKIPGWKVKQENQKDINKRKRELLRHKIEVGEEIIIEQDESQNEGVKKIK